MEKKKPIWKQWWFWLIVVVALATIGGGTRHESQTKSATHIPTATTTAPTADAPAVPTTQPTANVKEEPSASAVTPKDVVDGFVAGFAGPDGARVSDVAAIDLRDAGGEHYRPEYRLGAYDGAYGVHGRCGSLDVDVVAYELKDGRPTMMRVYASGSADAVGVMYPYVVRHFAPAITDADMDGLLARYRDGVTVPDVPAGSDVIAGSLLQRQGDVGELMVDAEI